MEHLCFSVPFMYVLQPMIQKVETLESKSFLFVQVFQYWLDLSFEVLPIFWVDTFCGTGSKHSGQSSLVKILGYIEVSPSPTNHLEGWTMKFEHDRSLGCENHWGNHSSTI